jgi:transposase
MNEERITESLSWIDPRGQVMKTPDDVVEMLRLKACGWGLKRIARQLGCSHHTVRVYVAAGGVRSFKVPERPKLLDGFEGWLRERFIRIAAMRMSCARERRDGKPANTATRRAALSSGAEGRGAGDDAVRDATGRQLQIDFGERLVEIGGVKIKAFVFVATLGHSRRLHVRAFRAEKAGALVRRARERVHDLRRRTGGSADGRSARARRAPRCGEPVGSVQ